MNSLIGKRGVIKGKLTRFQTFVNNLLSIDIDETQSITVIQINELRKRTDDTKPLLSQFEDIQEEIRISREETAVPMADDVEYTVAFEDCYFSTTAQADILIDKYHTNSSPENSLKSNCSGHHHSTVKLPTIQLPKFTGDVSQWLEFREIFKDLIHDNFEIKDIQKLHYLKGSLTGTASEIIKSLEFTSDNYQIAWASLCSMFDNPRMLVQNHLKAIFDFESLTKESATKLRKINNALFNNISALKTIASEQALLETILIFIISKKLDPKTFRQWESTKRSSNTELPTLEEFKQFLKDTADFLEAVEANQDKHVPERPKQVFERSKQRSNSFVSSVSRCSLCQGSHSLFSCGEFHNLTSNERMSKAKELKVCLNCLGKGHFLAKCPSHFTCRKCKARHHTILHPDVSTAQPKPVLKTESTAEATSTTSAFCSNAVQSLLPIASADIRDSTGNTHRIRILLDSGSQSNFILSDLCKRLSLPTKQANIMVSGLGQGTFNVQSRCDVELLAHHSPFKMQTSCLVIDKISGVMPGFHFNHSSFQIPAHIKLSDPSFHKPAEVDLLLGAPSFWILLCKGQIPLGPNLPILQKTRFGWIVSGPTSASLTAQIHCHVSCLEEAPDQLSRFWELENYPSERVFSKEENACEAHFSKTTQRDSDGRFIVSIPLSKPIEVLGDSFRMAQNRFLSLERRLQTNPALAERYTSFMKEYEELGHMSVVIPSPTEICYYLPHHGVLKEESLTTKLRVVFNGSATTSSGYSLNDIQLVGPTIQPDLFHILIRFRKYLYAISGDIEKMYRQVLVQPDQRCLQRILWRSSPIEPLKAYNLHTVTYGTASAAFLAIRSLTQLGIEYAESLPEISRIIREDFYVDDLLTGADSLDQAHYVCETLSDVLTKGCFKLRKWVSNEPLVLAGMHQTDVHPGVLELGTHEQSRILGLIWSFHADNFMYSISEPTAGKITKRVILSEISRIFDPLGLLSPCTIIAKTLMQELWKEKLSWDVSVPNIIQTKWNSYRLELTHLNEIRIPRHVLCPNPVEIQLHGFCDASLHAYGACIYLRSTNNNDQNHARLLCAKSKVAPLKTVTIPRLELCGAVLLARLSAQVLKSLNLPSMRCYLWSDSTIVLGWLQSSPHLLKTFVSHRVADIQQLTNNAIWKHVPTKSNPADLISRGVSPQQLKDSDIWWHGPSFLQEDESSWPISKKSCESLPEFKIQTECLASISPISFPFTDFSDLTRLERVVAYCFRFQNNCSKPKAERRFEAVSVKEIHHSMISLVKIAQAESFPDELKQLRQKNPVQPSSRLISLTPFLDLDGIIRVGGRLRNSTLPFSKKFPILMCGIHPLSKLIMSRQHIRLLHAGPQLMLSTLRESFWITSARNLARRIVHKCIKCYRFAPQITEPIMGDLPAHRVQPSHPFHVTGVDYAGPIMVKDRKGRGCKTLKSYICLFVCFSVKAVHLELVTDLSTQAFMLALKRFIARRGKPLHIYSDNGTNFVGASSELKELGTFLREQSGIISESVTQLGIDWHFVPARSPHFGGLWEAGVKSCKHHLRRVMGNALLTFEELCTVLTQVEAILNSRPMYPLSSDPNDLEPLTPAHFLVGRPLIAVPEPEVQDIQISRLSRYQLIQQLHQHFWSRWRNEYLLELQQRTKWRSNRSNLKEGILVLLKEDRAPPLQWRLGRVVKVHPGNDGIPRVATVKTSGGFVRRSFTKICPLPVN